MVKLSDEDNRDPEFSLMSKGMGNEYLTDAMIQYYRSRKLFCIVKEEGQIISMPRYYKNIIYTKEELQELYQTWLDEYNYNFLQDWELSKIEREKVEQQKAKQLKHDKQLKLKRISL